MRDEKAEIDFDINSCLKLLVEKNLMYSSKVIGMCFFLHGEGIYTNDDICDIASISPVTLNKAIKQLAELDYMFFDRAKGQRICLWASSIEKLNELSKEYLGRRARILREPVKYRNPKIQSWTVYRDQNKHRVDIG